MSPRERFLSYVRNPGTSRPVVSPFLPHPAVVRKGLGLLGLPDSGDDVKNEILLARALDYEPMFMTDCTGLMFPWEIDETASSGYSVTRRITTRKGEWTYSSPRDAGPWSDRSMCPVRTPRDHEMFVAACEHLDTRLPAVRRYFRDWRQRVGEDGVIVLGHPHPSWLGYQINPSAIYYHWNDDPGLYRASMDALCEAALKVMGVALDEGIDFMSDSSYGLEMTSPTLFREMDLPYIQEFASRTHDRGGLFWYHNCGSTRRLILDGTFNTLGTDVLETLAPAPEGDNVLAESRRGLDSRICTKGNFSLGILRDGTPEEIRTLVVSMVEEVRGYAHITSTADGVLPGTPPENFVAFVEAARAASTR